MKKISPAVVLICLLASVCLWGQEQEKKLIDRIQRPDMQQASSLQSKPFEGIAGSKVKSASSAAKAFPVGPSSAVHDFTGLRSFFGIKNPWFGQRTYDAKTAPLSSRSAAELAKTYQAKSAPVAPFSDSSKKADAPKPEGASKPFLLRGEAQGALQQISDKVKKEMTIDDVRELLNKPR